MADMLITKFHFTFIAMTVAIFTFAIVEFAIFELARDFTLFTYFFITATTFIHVTLLATLGTAAARAAFFAEVMNLFLTFFFYLEGLVVF